MKCIYNRPKKSFIAVFSKDENKVMTYSFVNNFLHGKKHTEKEIKFVNYSNSAGRKISSTIHSTYSIMKTANKIRKKSVADMML